MATEDLKAMLQQMLEKKKADKANEDKLRQEKNDGDRNKILENVGKDFGGVIQPFIDKMGENSRMSAEELKRIIAKSVQVTAPNVNTAGIENVISQAFANLKLPEPKVHVAAPIIPAPVIKLNSPDVKFPSSMKLTPNDKPFPVIMMDAGGKPMLFPIAGSSGPGFPMQTLDISTNSIRVSGSFSVTSSNASTQLIDSSLNPLGTNANPLNVTFAASGSQNVNLFDAAASSITSHAGRLEDFRGIDTVQLGVINVQSALNSTVSTLVGAGTFTGLAEDVKDFASIAVQVFSDQVSATDGLSIQQSSDGTNWDISDTYTIPASNGKTYSVQPTSRYFRIVYTNGGTPQGAFRLAATFHYHASQPSSQRTSDAYTNETDLQQFWSFNSHYNGSTWDRQSNQSGVSTNALRVQMATDAVSSVNVVGPIAQGDAASALRVVLAGNADASVVVNSGTITTVTTLTGITNTVTTRLDSPDGLYSAANPFPITVISGALTSTLVIGDSAARTADNGGNPVKVGGIARITNPTAYSDGDRANFATDKLGRLLTRNVQVRDLIKTAYATLSTQAETLLFGPTASAFNDLIMLTATNASAAAWKIDIRATGGGNIIHTMNVPANTGPVGFAPAVPWPASDQGAQWTATISSGADVSNANVFLSALFSQEI